MQPRRAYSEGRGGGGAKWHEKTDRDTNLSCLLHPQKAGKQRTREQREKGLIYKMSAAGVPHCVAVNRKST